MDDRTLLELAAKAAGHEVASWSDDGAALLVGVQEPWSPLADEFDALCLACDLLIDIDWSHENEVQAYHPDCPYAGLIEPSEPHDGTPESKRAAVCRAITRCAAEIGKALAGAEGR